MIKYVCAIFIENDLLLCCRSKNNDFWSFPIGDKPHHILYKSMVTSLKEDITSEFDIEFNICNVEIDYKDIFAELCYSKSSKIELSDKREIKWISVDEIDDVNWDSWAKPISQSIKEKLQKSHYIISLDNDGVCINDRDLNYNEISTFVEKVFDKKCSNIEARRMFIEIIKKQQIQHREGNTKWRIVRMYDENGNEICHES